MTQKRNNLTTNNLKKIKNRTRNRKGIGKERKKIWERKNQFVHIFKGTHYNE